MMVDPGMALYGSALALIWGVYSASSRRQEIRNAAIKKEALQAGVAEPMTMHPRIDPAKCVGCGACSKACPEGDVLGVLSGRAELISGNHCIGHGECAKACPVGAISIVFGTATRGVELPHVNRDFETNVRGLYVAGELGGMGLIRNAVEQGRQAVEAIARRGRAAVPGGLDLIIVGAGPAGIAAALAAKSLGLRYQVIEQDDLGGGLIRYPRRKVVMAAPMNLPIIGLVRLRETSKEELLRLWRAVEAEQQLRISYRERVESVQADGGGFRVQTVRRLLTANSVLLATGRRGTPRRLDVPGEELPKVVYQMIDAEQYSGRKVLVAGGGDSALEAAVQLAEQPGTTVTLSYRGGHFARGRPSNRQAVEDLSSAGRLRVMMSSVIERICETSVEIAWNGSTIALPNDAVIICAGGLLPADFLQRCGVVTETKYGTA